jgi:hypothetical protein
MKRMLVALVTVLVIGSLASAETKEEKKARQEKERADMAQPLQVKLGIDVETAKTYLISLCRQYNWSMMGESTHRVSFEDPNGVPDSRAFAYNLGRAMGGSSRTESMTLQIDFTVVRIGDQTEVSAEPRVAMNYRSGSSRKYPYDDLPLHRRILKLLDQLAETYPMKPTL